MSTLIRNYKDHDTVLTRLVLLKGLIPDCILPVNQPDVDYHAVVYDETRLRKRSYPIKVTKNGFVTLIELFDGPNLIELTHPERYDEFHLELQRGLDDQNELPFAVKPLIIVAKDEFDGDDGSGLPLDAYIDRIELGLELMQTFFSEKLYEMGFPRRSFQLVNGGFVRMETTPEQLQQMSINQVWKTVAQEIMTDPNLWNETTKYIGFLMHPWDNIDDPSASHLALGGGGLALMYSDFISIWPENAHDILNVLEDSNNPPGTCKTLPAFHESVGRLYGASLGQLAHELGHVFDLGHTAKGLMGTDFHRFSLSLLPPVLANQDFRVNNAKSVIPITAIMPCKVYLPSGEIMDDVVQLLYSSATILYHSRWFYPFDPTTASCVKPSLCDSIELVRHIIVAGVGIVAIEIRDTETGQVLSSHTFEKATEKPLTFSLGRRDVPLSHSNVPVLLVIQDETGFILKTSLDRSLLPEGVTKIQRRDF